MNSQLLRPISLCGLIVGALASPCPGVAESEHPQCEVTSGGDGKGYLYSWTISNRGPTEITTIEFPFCHGALLLAPKGWITELDSTGPDKKGCRARVSKAAEGLAPGQSAVFEIQTNPSRASRGLGAIIVRFGDGSERTVNGVTLPLPEPWGEKYVPLIGLAVIFAAGLIFRLIRRARISGAPAGRRMSASST